MGKKWFRAIASGACIRVNTVQPAMVAEAAAAALKPVDFEYNSFRG